MPDFVPMTDLDSTLNEPGASQLPPAGRPEIWRIVSLVTVVVAVILTAISVLLARGASDVQIPDRPDIELESASVTLGDIGAAVSNIAVLGLPHDSSRQAFTAGGTSIDIPKDTAAVVAAYDENASMVGLAIIRDPAEGPIEISAESTAHALLALSPGVLRPNLNETFASLGAIEADDAYRQLVSAVLSNPDLTATNEALEIAYAAIADRVPVKPALADQGCDSVSQRDAFAAAGACVQPTTTGMLITNQQDRWALLYSGDDNWSELCATVSPANTNGDEAHIERNQCGALTLIVAPGPTRDSETNEANDTDKAIVEERLRTAAAVNVLYNYAGPFADLAGGGAGFVNESTSHIRRKASEVAGSLRLAAATNDDFAAAIDVTVGEATAQERHLAMISSARYLLELSDSTSLIPHRAPGDQQHVPLLDFYERAASRMVAERTATQWEAVAVGHIDFGSLS